MYFLKNKDFNKGGSQETSIISGRNAVSEALVSGRPINSVYIKKGGISGSLKVIVSKAKQQGIAVKEVDQKKLDFMCGFSNHQGVAASAAEKEFSSFEDILDCASDRKENPFILICDEIEDPHNFGAILRTAECSGAHGVIIPKRRSAGLTFSVGKASAGAIEHIHVARVNNLADTIEKLKSQGIWIYAADMDGDNWCELDYRGPCALVIGSEGKGISRLIKEKSDFKVSLPLMGKINSLNASVAAGILSYEICRQRKGLKSFNF